MPASVFPASADEIDIAAIIYETAKNRAAWHQSIGLHDQEKIAMLESNDVLDGVISDVKKAAPFATAEDFINKTFDVFKSAEKEIGIEFPCQP